MTVKVQVMEKIAKYTKNNFAFKNSDADKNILKVLIDDGMIVESKFQQGSKFLKHYLLTDKGKAMINQ